MTTVTVQSAGSRCSGWARRLSIVIAVAVLLALPSVAAAGQIVWVKGTADTSIWAMNDDGSNAHALITPSQIPGMVSLYNPTVDPAGHTVMFSAGDANIWDFFQTGIYSWSLGNATRVSPAPYPCSSECAVFADYPSLASNGTFAYELSACSEGPPTVCDDTDHTAALDGTNDQT